ncbi:MAG: beta strand repeat-containing protein, partial [Bacteroidota bacterium]
MRDPNTTADFVNTLTAEFNGVTLSALTPITLGTANLVNNSSCTTPNGQVAANLSGGSAALLPAGSGSFNYTWTGPSGVSGLPATGTWKGDTNLDLATVISSTGLPGGTYTLQVQDNLSTCTQTKAYTITNPTPTLFNTATTTPTVCKGATGTITLSGSSGSSVTYEVFLNGSATGNQLTGTGSALSFTIPGATFSSAGTYSFTIRAKDGFCDPAFMTGTATITVNADVTFTSSVTNAACNGAATGSITVSASGGSSPYTYSSDNGTTFQASNVFSNLLSGVYPVVVKDALGCTSSVGSVTVNQPPAITFTAAAVDPACAGGTTGSLTLTATGGTGSYTYSINNGSTYQASSSFTGLASGTYTAKVKDSAGCESAGQSITLNNPTPVTFTASKTDPLCSTGNTGSIAITASGGTGPYQYSINNGSTFSGSATSSNLAAGTYTVIVKDSKSCLATAATVTLTTPAAVTVSSAVTNETCPGNGNASILLTGAGGTGPYTYSINNGSSFQAGATFTSVAAGTYQVQAKDANGCVSATGTATVTAKTPITVSTSKTNISTCSPGNDGAVTLTASGGTGPFTYSLDNGVTFGASGTFSGLTAGTYSAVAKDNLGCLSSTVSVTFALPFTVSLTGTGSNLICNGSADGSIALTATGGNGTYTYSKDNGLTFSAGATFSSLAAGTYSLVAKDGANCQATTTVTLTEPAVLTVTPVGTNILCNGLSTGAISVTATGGNGGYTYSSDNGVTF